MTRRNAIILTVTLVVAGVLFAAAAVAAFLYFSFKGIGARNATGDERKLVITTASLAEFGIEGLDQKKEKLVSKRAIDGALEIECENEAEGVFFVSGAEVHSRARGARESFALTIGAWKTGVAIGSDAAVEPAQSLLGIGEQRWAAYITSKGEKVGNMFIVRDGRVLHSLLISGYYFDDPEDVKALLEPLLAESKRPFGTSR